jgi:hypothetical protein
VSSSNHPDRSRRSFLTLAAATGSASLLGLRPGLAPAQAAEHVSVTDPLAVSLGYVEDATKVDQKKFATYKPGQKCSGCRFYQGTAGQAYGPCQIFANKAVNANGWCVSFNAKT